MRVAALSGLHIGLDGRTDAFGNDAGAFASFPGPSLAIHDRIVLLGDLFTADHAPVRGPSHARAHQRRILTRVPWSADRLANPVPISLLK